MVDAVWPVGIPFEPEQSGYSESPRNNASVFQPSVGPPTISRRSTLTAFDVNASILLTSTEKATWLTFYQTTLQNGTLPFEWANPSFSSTGRYVFDPQQGPQLQSVGFDLFRLRFRAIRLRDA